MNKYVVCTDSVNRSGVTLSCKLGNYHFNNGDIVSKNEYPEIEELKLHFPKIFLKISEPEEVKPIVVPEPEDVVIVEPISEEDEIVTIEELKDVEVEVTIDPISEETEDVVEESDSQTDIELPKRKGRPKK
jgi:hypothetical protein